MPNAATRLIVCIVHEDDVGPLRSALAQEDFESTVISSTGGFLRKGNATLLIGVESWRAERILDIIRRTCRTHIEKAPPPQEGTTQVGAAIVFTLDVEQYLRI